jgi:hypothetical protein
VSHLSDVKATYRMEYSRVITFDMIRAARTGQLPLYADEWIVYGSKIERDREWFLRWIKGQRTWQHKASHTAAWDAAVEANPHMYLAGRIAACRRARLTTRARRTQVTR